MATKWGIVSAGKICHDFVTAVQSVAQKDDHKFVAVAARNLKSAQEFACRHNIAKAYGSYQELAEDPDIEVVYVGTIQSHHFEVGKLMLEHGKHVLMEKPMTLNVKQTKGLIEIAVKHKRFLMEAVWSRFLPSYKHLMQLLKKESVGEVKHVDANFGKHLLDVERLVKRSDGGGSILDLGIYALNAISMVYNNEKPKKIAAVGHLNEDGVDITMASSLSYSKNRTAQVTSNVTADLPCTLTITGTKGHIKLPDNMWCATTIETPNETFDFPLPDPIMPLNFINSTGLAYEAMEVRKCLEEGVLESSIMPLKDSVMLAEMMDEIRRQIGVKFDAD